MNSSDVLSRLRLDGVRLELSLRGANLKDGHRALIREHRSELIDALARTLEGPNVPFLPRQLERLVSAASSGVLPEGVQTLPSGLVTDLDRHVLAWGCSCLIGDHEYALARLWEAHRVWQRVT